MKNQVEIEKLHAAYRATQDELERTLGLAWRIREAAWKKEKLARKKYRDAAKEVEKETRNAY